MAGTGDNQFIVRGFAMSVPHQACLEAIEFLQWLGYWHIDWPEGEGYAHVVVSRRVKRFLSSKDMERWRADLVFGIGPDHQTTVTIDYQFRPTTWTRVARVIAAGEINDLLAWLADHTIPMLDRKAQLADARLKLSTAKGCDVLLVATFAVSYSYALTRGFEAPAWLLPALGGILVTLGSLLMILSNKPRQIPLTRQGPNLPKPGLKFDPGSDLH